MREQQGYSEKREQFRHAMYRRPYVMGKDKIDTALVAQMAALSVGALWPMPHVIFRYLVSDRERQRRKAHAYAVTALKNFRSLRPAVRDYRTHPVDAYFSTAAESAIRAAVVATGDERNTHMGTLEAAQCARYARTLALDAIHDYGQDALESDIVAAKVMIVCLNIIDENRDYEIASLVFHDGVFQSKLII